MKHFSPGVSLLLVFCIVVLFVAHEGTASAASCTPTAADELGPFYRPGAPLRSSVGKGFVLRGVVRTAVDCGPVSGAVIEFWLAGPDGGYDDAHRATIIADTSGRYHFESNVPPPYYGRPPHIHLRVSAQGHATLVTQYYPVAGKKDAVFDIVLVPSR